MIFRLLIALFGLIAAAASIPLLRQGHIVNGLVGIAGAVLCILISLFPHSPIGPKKPQDPPGDK